MNSLVPGTIQPRPRSIQLGHSRDIEHLLQTHKFFDPCAHGITASLRAEDHLLERNFVFQISAVYLLGHQQAHGGRTAHRSGLKINQKLTLQVDVARPNRKGHGSKFLTTQLKPYPRRPDTVSHGNLHPVFGGNPGHLIASGKEMDPIVDIFLGVAQNFPFAHGTGRGMDSNHLGLGNRKKWKRIVFAQVIGCGERQFSNVIQRSKVFGTDAGCFQLFPIKGRSPVGMVNRPLQAF